MTLGWTIVSKIAGSFVYPLLLFIPAGTLYYWQAWTFLAAWYIPGAIAFQYFSKRDPAVLRRRTRMKETRAEQKPIMLATYTTMFVAFLIAGLDFRLGWTRELLAPVPLSLQLIALLVVLAGRLLTYWVMDVNHYAARTVQVEAGQKVISGGPYKWVRHPMYLGLVLMMLFTPLALASYFALPLFTLTVPLLLLRLVNEERVLQHDLTGYAEYCQGTRYRLVPYMW
jgi:protein-S-isoprenylcysteine O-methyltransferase Ste14